MLFKRVHRLTVYTLFEDTSRGFRIPPGIFADAIQYFWDQRSRQAANARGGEGQGRNVRGGMHLDGVQAAIVTLMIDHGVPAGDIFTNCALYKTGRLELPGFFRPTKQWDLLAVRDGRLLAAMELKAQVGPSFGNNFNNRTEEAMGSALAGISHIGSLQAQWAAQTRW